MAKNKIQDLNDHLFEQLERLNDNSLNKETMEIEAKRAKAMTGIATQIVNSHKVTLEAMKLIASGNLRTTEIPGSFGINLISQ